MNTTLFKRDNSPYYQLHYFLNGKQTRVSTKCKLKKDALIFQENLENKLKINAGIIDADKITLKDLVDKVISDYKMNKKKSANRVEHSAKHLYEYFGENKPVINITSDDIDKFKLHEIEKVRDNKKGYANATINRSLSTLKRGFSLYKNSGKLNVVPHISLLAENNIRTSWMEYHQYLRLLEVASPHIVNVIKFAYTTGWRKEEILGLKFSMVDMQNGSITLPVYSTKNNESRTIYMDDDIKSMFQNIWNKVSALYPNCEYVFENKGQRIKDLRTAWKNSCKRAGLEKYGFHLHDFRRCACRNYLKSGCSSKLTMDLLGHKTDAIMRRYAITSEADKKLAAQKLRNYLNNQIVLDENGYLQEGAAAHEYDNMIPPAPVED